MNSRARSNLDFHAHAAYHAAYRAAYHAAYHATHAVHAEQQAHVHAPMMAMMALVRCDAPQCD